jgi:hypothetical protein
MGKHSAASHLKPRSWKVLLAAMCFGWIALVLLTPPSAWSAEPEILWQVPERGQEQQSAKAGSLAAPRAIAADRETGHVFIAEEENHRISEFTSWGVFVKAWGYGVKDGSPNLQVCTQATGCLAGLQGTGAGQLDFPNGLTVDSDGNVWVSEHWHEGAVEQERVQKFSAAGAFLLMVGKEVDKTTHEDLCTAASGDVCGTGIRGTGPSEFSNGFTTDAIEAEPYGSSIYIGDVGRIEALNTDGTFKESITLSGQLGEIPVRSLALNPAGGWYLAMGGLKNVRQIAADGTETAQLDTELPPKALTTDIEGHLYVIAETFYSAENTYPVTEVLEFGADGSCLICTKDEFASPPPIPETKEISGLWAIAANVEGPASQSSGDIYVAEFSPEGVGNRSDVSAYGKIPRFEPAPLRDPDIADEAALGVTPTSAEVRAEINPHFYQATEYFVEYGPNSCDVGPCTATSAQPLGAERNVFAPTAAIRLGDLLPSTSYHYRFVAVNGPATVTGEDHSFITPVPHPPGLPDDRAYEMVSPAEKNNGEAGGARLTAGPNQAAPDGEAMAWTAFSAFQNPLSASGGTQYLSRRTSAGWVTENTSPPDREGYLEPPVIGFSEDLGRQYMAVREPRLLANAAAGFLNLYRRDGVTGEVDLISEGEPVVAPRAGYCVQYDGESADGKRIFFSAGGALTPDAPVAEGVNLYEWTKEAGVRLVSIKPNGQAAEASPFSGFGDPATAGRPCTSEVLHNAISSDGTRAFWTMHPPGPSRQLLVRIDGLQTLALDANQGGVGPAGNGVFLTASDDGSVAFFTAPGKLVAGASNYGLYRYDLEAPAGQRLTLLTPGPEAAKVLGMLGASEDGRRIYFAAQGALDPGAEQGRPNLYLWEEGSGIRFIATLASVDNSDWVPTSVYQRAGSNSTGSVLAFTSVRPLTGYDNTGRESEQPTAEVFLYDAEADALDCVSCNPTGARPQGGASLPAWSTPFEQSRFLSADGRRLFFMSSDGLDVNDENQAQDVYEFERPGVGTCTEQQATYVTAAGGCLFLISSGDDHERSALIDASPDGRDIFFATTEALVKQDEDVRFDIYDARVGGGFPAPPPPPTPCANSEECHGTAPPFPASSTAGSAGFTDHGPEPIHRSRRKCRRPSVRRHHGKCTKKKGPSRHHRHHRAATKERSK